MGYAPENTMSSFLRAIADGVDGIELDVHLTKDNEVVVIHDEMVDRTTDGSGWIKDMTLKEIRKLDAGGWFGQGFRGERIPLLYEVIKIVKEYKKLCFIEMKLERFYYKGIERRVYEVIKSLDYFENSIVISFVMDGVKNIKRLGLKCGFLTSKSRHVPQGVDWFCPRYNLVDEEAVLDAHKKNTKVLTWTVNDLIDFKRLMGLNVDAIATNYPKNMLKAYK